MPKMDPISRLEEQRKRALETVKKCNQGIREKKKEIKEEEAARVSERAAAVKDLLGGLAVDLLKRVGTDTPKLRTALWRYCIKASSGDARKLLEIQFPQMVQELSEQPTATKAPAASSEGSSRAARAPGAA